jgi:predicted MPP superfamily phosphohydrolase
MKTINFIIFFGIFFTVYGLINYYLFLRGWQSIPPGSPVRTVYLIAFLFFSLAFIAGRFLERAWLSPVSEAFVWIGSFWLAAMLYFFLIVVFLDLLRLANHIVPFFPAALTEQYATFKQLILASVVFIVSCVLAAGHINASIPRVHELSIRIAKPVNGMDSMTVVSASDIHLGSIIGREKFDGIVRKINALNPDLVLIPGDLVDEDLAPVIKENLGEALRTIRARYGILAITGNHEYIGGVEAACTYMTEHGITVLRDSVARVGPGIYVVGREDRSIGQFSGKKRKSLEELMRDVDARAPVILLDHQPFGLDEGMRNGVDLQISGHTHHGQLWPLNYITSAIYEVSWGYLRKGDTHIYVSTGVGTWGPPVRIGNRPEILHIKLTFG